MPYPLRPVPLDELDTLITPIFTALGIAISPEVTSRIAAIPELDVRLGAYDGEQLVGAAGSLSFELTVPGGTPVQCAGLTLVGVLPTHRRRGILRSLMRQHLDDAYRRGQPLAALYASEGLIYGRFGYGVASLDAEFDLRREDARFLRPVEAAGCTRLVSEAEALATFPTVYQRVRRTIPGMLSRSEAWWSIRRLPETEWQRNQSGPLNRVLLELDGRPAAYALYRVKHLEGPQVTISIIEALGDSPLATRALWRYLLDLDLARRFIGGFAPADHPLLLLLAEPRRLGLRLGDALWVRLIDVERALSLRRYLSAGPLVLEVEDAFCPWNSGRFRISEGRVERTSAAAELSLDVDALGSLYLGGFSASALAQAGRVHERVPGALLRADALFHGSQAPWCPELF